MSWREREALKVKPPCNSVTEPPLLGRTWQVQTPALRIWLQRLSAKGAVTLSHAELAHSTSTTGKLPLPEANATPKDRDDQQRLERVTRENEKGSTENRSCPGSSRPLTKGRPKTRSYRTLGVPSRPRVSRRDLVYTQKGVI